MTALPFLVGVITGLGLAVCLATTGAAWLNRRTDRRHEQRLADRARRQGGTTLTP